MFILAQLGKSLCVTLLFSLLGIGVLLLAHFLFHFVVKKLSHGTSLETLISDTGADVSTSKGLAIVAYAIVYGLSELAFVGGVALIIAHVAS